MGALVLVGCGQVERAAPGADTAGAGAASTAGAPTTPGVSGTAGIPEPPEAPAVDISGRWGMFTFDDPVGVQLFQNGAELAGLGCASGVPPLTEPLGVDYCGGIVGSVDAHFARFVFTFRAGDATVSYRSDVTVSANGQRMAGSFRAFDDQPRPMAWLRVPDGEPWLDSNAFEPNQPLIGHYSLWLKEAIDGGTEYSGSQPYGLRYTEQGISGALGSFWLTELKRRSPEGPIDVGPVPATLPTLAVAMTLELDGGALVLVRASTASGFNYIFSAARAEAAQ